MRTLGMIELLCALPTTVPVDGFAADCIVRKKRCIATVTRRPVSQQANSRLRTEPVVSFGFSSFLVY